MFETKNLILRNFAQTDLDDLFELTSNKRLCSMSGLIYVKDKDLVDVVLERFIKKEYAFAVVLKETNKVVGLVELMEYNEKLYHGLKIDDGAKEIVFILNENYWGKGIMREAVNEVLKFAFNKLNVSQVLAGNFIENNQSANFQNKIGLKKVGEIGHFRIVENYQTIFVQRILTKEDYLKRQN